MIQKESKPSATSKLVKAWEAKNAKRAVKASGATLMALSLSACGGSDDVATETTPVVPVGTTAALTIGSDLISGDAGDDTLHGVVDADTAGSNTLNSSDVIDLGAGTDTLNITFEVASSAAMPSADISGVEVFNVKNVSGNSVTVNMASIDGETSVANNISTSALTFSNMAAGTTASVVGNSAVTNAASTFGYVAAATSSAVTIADGVTAGNITVTGTGLLTQTVTSTGSANTVGAIANSATVTDLNIIATNDLTTGAISGTALDTITITGAGDVDLDAAALAATVGTVDASAASGAVSINLGNFATDDAAASGVDLADITVSGGSGDDTLDVDGAAATLELSVDAGAGDDTVVIGADGITTSSATQTGDVLVGGDGTDILSVTTAAAQAQGAVDTVSGFEELTITGALANSVTVSNYQAGLNTVNLAAGGTGTLVMEAGSNTVNLQGQLTNTLTLTDTGTAISDSVTVVNENAAADAFNGDAIAVNGFETLNLVTTGTGAATAQSFGAITVTADTGGTSTVNVSGSNVANIDGTVTAHALDFSGMTAQAAGTATADMTGVAFEYAGTTGAGAITGSAGDDVLVGDTGEATNIDGGAGDDTITGSSVAETINGGAGNDTIVGNGGADTLNGNDGDDTITIAGAGSVDGGAGDDTVVAAGNVTFGQTIVGGEGDDTLSVNAAISAANASVVTGFETLTLATAGTTDLDNFGNNTFTNVNLTAGSTAQTVASVRDETITVTAALSADATVTMEDATGSADTATIVISSAAAVDTTNDVLVAGVETINLVMTDTNTTAHQNTLDLGADSATTLSISGNAGVVFATGGGTDIADVTTMDASGVVLGAVTDAGVTYVATYNTVGGVTTITGSNGVDSLTGGANTADTISGGAGVDTIVYTGGADTFTGGAGNDVFDINADGTATSFVTITDLAAGDTINLADVDDGTTGIADGALGAAISLGSAATLADYLDAAAADDTDADSNSVLDVSIANHFQFDGNTYLVVDNNVSTSFTAGSDSVIMISGLVDLEGDVFASSVLTIA